MYESAPNQFRKSIILARSSEQAILNREST